MSVSICKTLYDPRVDCLPRKIDLVVFDFDGVFTDGRVIVGQDGHEAVICSRRDGMGVDLLRKNGVPCVILSGEPNSVVTARAQKLGIEAHSGVDDKLAMLDDLLERRGIMPAHVVYVGDDVNDVSCLRYVGCGVTPADAHPSLGRAADIRLNARGGCGAVREIADLILARIATREHNGHA
jgi:N-acylneuraminate cytidylyltransferase